VRRLGKAELASHAANRWKPHARRSDIALIAVALPVIGRPA
jgi:hypothetical protein